MENDLRTAPDILRKSVDPIAVGLVRSFDLHAELLGQGARATAMVDMTVCQQDLLDGYAGLSRRRLEARQIAARIDERAAHRRGAPQQRAILLERRDRDDRGAERWLAHR